MNLKEITKKLEDKMQCNCDLDNWQPEISTGHSWVCRIHKQAKRIAKENKNYDYCPHCGNNLNK